MNFPKCSARNTRLTSPPPVEAQFKAPSPDMDALIKFGAGLLLFLGMTFSAVSWNPATGLKHPLLCSICVLGFDEIISGTIVQMKHYDMDGG